MHSERVQFLIDNRNKLVEERHQFVLKYDFHFKRPQYFKNCIVIRWKTSRKPYELTPLFYKRIEEYVAISHKLSDKYDLWDKNDCFCDEELRLVKAGIYVCYESYKIWAIPNEFKETQDYILNKVPKWAKVAIKCK